MKAAKGAFAVVFVLFCISAGFADPNDINQDDWRAIWKISKMPVMAKPQTSNVEKGTLGADLNGISWQVTATRYHALYFTDTIDKQKLKKVCALIDNVYDFLQGRTPSDAKPASAPIKVFLVPQQLKQSRCCPEANAMRTGDQGDIFEIITSLLHEETHLFNMANLSGKPQNWWLGEFSCQYFQTRAALSATKKDIRRYVCAKLPTGPGLQIGELENAGRDAFDEAFAAMYFFEEQYGKDALRQFRAHLLKAAQGDSAKNSFDAFGEEMPALEQKWLAYYGWKSVQPTQPNRGQADDSLNRIVSYNTERQSIQTVVKTLAQEAQIGYNWTKSYQQTEPVCRNWLYNVNIQNQPIGKALEDLLTPAGLTYKIENGSIVLYKK